MYLDNLIALKDKTPIKIITGVRRCGKSTLLDLHTKHLLAQGIPAERILRINFELKE